jgi:hypothetical protein
MKPRVNQLTGRFALQLNHELLRRNATRANDQMHMIGQNGASQDFKPRPSRILRKSSRCPENITGGRLSTRFAANRTPWSCSQWATDRVAAVFVLLP